MLKASAPQKRIRSGSWCFFDDGGVDVGGVGVGAVVVVDDHLTTIGCLGEHFGGEVLAAAAADDLTFPKKRRCRRGGI